MVLVSRLAMKGFKSFGRFTSIEFPKGYTAIVGPNGSGKSNVLDALCFVLGRLGTKSLRADRLSELIFNGAKTGKPASRAEVAITFDNSKGELPLPEKEVEVVRQVHKSGKSVYRINGAKSTRSQIVDVLSKARISPKGHNIILQGDIAHLVQMNAEERRKIIDEISGIAEYEEKKRRALHELEKVGSKIGEAEATRKERKKYMDQAEQDRDRAERYKSLTEKVRKYKAENLLFKISKAEKEIKRIEKEKDKFVGEEEKIQQKVAEKEAEISELQKQITEIDEQMVSGESRFRKEINEADVQLSSLREQKKHIEEKLKGFDDGIGKLKGEIEGLKAKQAGAGTEIENLKAKQKEYEDALKLKAQELKELKAQVEGRRALEPKTGKSVLETISAKIDGLIKLVEEKMGKVEAGELKEAEFKGVLSKIKTTVGGFKTDIESASLQNKELIKALGEVEKLSGEIDKIRVEKAEAAMELSRLSANAEAIMVGEKERQIAGLEKEKGEHGTEDVEKRIGELEKKREELEKRDRDATPTKQVEKKKQINMEVSKLQGHVRELFQQQSDLQRRQTDFAGQEATHVTRLADFRELFKEFGEARVEIKHSEAELDRLVQKYEREVSDFGMVNMLAIEAFDEVKRDYDDLMKKMETLEGEKKAVEDFIAEIDEKKRDAFMETFLEILGNFEQIYGRLDPNGEAHLILETPDDPFEAGMLMQVKPRGQEQLNIEALSGGQKTMVGIAFLFAIQKFRPAPFYVLDEVDAALDKVNSDLFGQLLIEYAKNKVAQFIVITHNDTVLEKADRLYGVSMTKFGSQIVGVEMPSAG